MRNKKINTANLLDGKPHTYLGQVATATMIPQAQNTTASTTAMTRKAHYSRDNINSLQLAYANWWVNTGNTILGAESSNGNSIAINAWIEYPVGTYTQLKFNGSITLTLADLTTALSDVLSIQIPINTLFYTWTYVAPSTGNNFPYTLTTQVGNPLFYTGTGNLGEACKLATSAVPTTPTALTDNFSGRRGYWPSAIVAQTAKKSYFLLGDSRTAGVHDTADATADLGNLARAIGPTRAYINCGIGGDRISSFLASGTLRLALSQYCSHVIDELGVNAFYQQASTTAVPAEAYKQRSAGRFNGRPYVQTTLEPVTTSTDNWATTGNQTVFTESAARIAYNDWIRTQPNGVSYLELANAVETSQDSGIWDATGSANGYTFDGVHEVQAGNQLIQNSAISGISGLAPISPAAIELLPKINVPAISMTMNSIAGTTVTYTTGEFGSAVNGGYPYFYGAIPGCPPYSFECWANNASIVNGYVFGGGPVDIFTAVTTGFAEIKRGDGTAVSSSTNICDGGWHHLAVTITNAGVIVLYVDGTSVATSTLSSWGSGNWNSEYYPFMLRAQSGSSIAGASNPWTNGIVDEVALWNNVKYTGNFTPPTQPYVGNEPNLLALWHLDGNLNGIAGSAF